MADPTRWLLEDGRPVFLVSPAVDGSNVSSLPADRLVFGKPVPHCFYYRAETKLLTLILNRKNRVGPGAGVPATVKFTIACPDTWDEALGWLRMVYEMEKQK